MSKETQIRVRGSINEHADIPTVELVFDEGSIEMDTNSALHLAETITKAVYIIRINFLLRKTMQEAGISPKDLEIFDKQIWPTVTDAMLDEGPEDDEDTEDDDATEDSPIDDSQIPKG